MTGLIEKDIRLILKRKQALFMVLFIAVAYGFVMDASFVVGYTTIFSAILTISTLSYDEMENGYSFLMTLPINTDMYVLEKYLFSAIAGISFWAVSVCFLFLSYMIKGTSVDPVEEILSAMIIIPVFLIFVDVMVPLQLKYGAEGSRIVLMIIAGAIAVIMVGGKTIADKSGVNLEELINRLDQFSLEMLIGSALLFALLITVISVFCSLRIMKKREF